MHGRSRAKHAPVSVGQIAERWIVRRVARLRGHRQQCRPSTRLAAGSRVGEARCDQEHVARYGASMGPVDWDERYASHDEGLWSGRVNGALVAEVAGLPPGRALDVGCGEEADAIWLARAGWQATGVDISEVALERAAEGAHEAGVSVEGGCADITVSPPPPDAYDLVSVQYPALKRSPGDEAIRAILGAISPGGTVLVVGHTPVDPDSA